VCANRGLIFYDGAIVTLPGSQFERQEHCPWGLWLRCGVLKLVCCRVWGIDFECVTQSAAWAAWCEECALSARAKWNNGSPATIVGSLLLRAQRGAKTHPHCPCSDP